MPKTKKPAEVWLTDAVVLTQNRKREVFRGNIQIIDGRIAALTTRTPSRTTSKTLISAKGLVLVPGFVQTHVHLCQTLFRNLADDLELLDWLSKKIWIYEAAHTEETLHTSALLGASELLTSGTTTILDMGTVRHTDALFEAVKLSGLRASIGKCLMDHPEQTPKYLRDDTDAALSEAQDLFDRWHKAENDRLRVSYAPRFVISCTEELLNGVSEIAQSQKALVHTHASENLKEIELVREMTGFDNVEYLHHIGMTKNDLVLAHCVWLTPKEMKMVAEKGVHVSHCPSSNLKLASGIARVPEMLAQKINVSLGADGAPCNNNLNMFQEMRLAALIQKPGHGPRAMRAQDVLDMATRNGARALQWDRDIGSIEVGKKADLFAVDLNALENGVDVQAWSAKKSSPEPWVSALVYSTQPHHVRWTMVDGRVVAKDGALTAVSNQELVSRRTHAQKEIFRRANAL